MGSVSLVSRPIPFRDPVEAFAALRGDGRPVLLDSAMVDGERGRFSLVASDPFAVFECDAAGALVDGNRLVGNPFDLLSRALAGWAIPAEAADPPLGPGAIGMLCYEAGRHADRMPEPQADGLDFPDMALGFYDPVAVFDAVERRGWVLSAGWPETEPAARRGRAERRADELAAVLAAARPLLPIPWEEVATWFDEMTADGYRAAVRRILRWIVDGDIYQACLTRRFLADLPAGLEPFDLYRRLRRISPAPFAAFLDLGEGRWIASASPERFLRVDAGGRVETRPIKGTRPRGWVPQEDMLQAAALRESDKDRAENLMIVDLLRNDLSRVCAVGSVRVPALYRLETFPRVHHLVSVVEGRLEAGRTSVDLLRAAFPGGSITGAPKIRAIEILRELEPARRGPYCGSIVRLGFDGTLDSSIVIRTLCGAGGRVAAQAGGGIVADLDPALEQEESMVKVAPLLRALAGPST